jgi:hypothetical protein
MKFRVSEDSKLQDGVDQHQLDHMVLHPNILYTFICIVVFFDEAVQYGDNATF